MVEIKYGEYKEQADLAGKSVAEAREQYQTKFDIPDKAQAYLNGKKIKNDLEPDIKLGNRDELLFKEKSKIPVLLMALLLAMAITGGMFAYAFFTATATIGVTAPGADFAEVSENVTASGWSACGFVTGNVTSGNLFTIDTIPCGYTGDMVATVYLSNAEQLAKVYRLLVLKIEVHDSLGKIDINGDGVVDAVGHKDYALLTLRNGATDLFITQQNPPDTYFVKLAGGFYRTHIWGRGWTTDYQSPQLLLEVAQR